MVFSKRGILKSTSTKPQNVTLFGNRVFMGIIKLNEVIKVALIPILPVSLKKMGNLDTDAHRQRMSCEEKSRDRGDTSTSQRKPERASKLPEAGGEAGNGFFLTASKGINPADALILDFWSPDCETMNFCC